MSSGYDIYDDGVRPMRLQTRLTDGDCAGTLVQDTSVGNSFAFDRRRMRSASVSHPPPSALNGYWRPPTNWDRVEVAHVYPRYLASESGFGWYHSCGPSNGPFSFRRTINNMGSAQHDVNYLDLTSPSVFDETVVNRGKTKLLNSMKNEGEASLGLALLERAQTTELLSSTIRTIAKTIQNFSVKNGIRKLREIARKQDQRAELIKRNGKLSKREEALLKIPEKWLEVQYGWSPLMSDVQSSLEAVDYYQRNDFYRFSKRSKVAVDDMVRRELVASLSNHVLRADTRQTIRYILRVDYQVVTSGLSTLASLGLANPLNLLWEKLPWSFVLDWMYPVGTWLNTFDATLGKQFSGGTETRVISWPRAVYTVHKVGPSGFTTQTQDLGSTECLFMRRRVLSSFPSASPPAFKNPCSPVHVANALALLATALGKGVPRGIPR